MTIIKLNTGDRLHFTVASTEHVQGQYGPQIKFNGSTPNDSDATLFLNVDTAVRQLSRIGLDQQTVIGQTVEIARTEKNGTKYTDINRVSGAAVAPRAATPAPAKAAYSSGPNIQGLDDAPVDINRLDRVFHLYDACLAHTLGQVVPKLDASPVGSSPEAVAAITATLFIQASNKGLAA